MRSFFKVWPFLGFLHLNRFYISTTYLGRRLRVSERLKDGGDGVEAQSGLGPDFV